MPTLFCRFCSESKISQWKGLPEKQVIPLLSELVDGACRECKTNDIQSISNSDIQWANIHSDHSTGLPIHWQLVIATGANLNIGAYRISGQHLAHSVEQTAS